MNFYIHLQSVPQDIYAYSAAIPRDKDAYYSIRKTIVTEPFNIIRASYFYYLNRNCFNGLYRTNRKGEFNVPFAPNRTGAMPTLDELEAASLAIQEVEFVESDFAQVVFDNLDSGSFFFFDPPYALKRRQPFVEYSADAFTKDDINRLVDCLKAIDDIGAKFAITYDAALAQHFAIREHWIQDAICVRRNISGFAGSRRTATEVITTNYPSDHT